MISSNQNVNQQLGNLLNSTITLRFVISLLVMTITLASGAAGWVWVAARQYQQINDTLAGQIQAFADLKENIEKRGAARDAHDNSQDAQLVGLTTRVGVLEWRVDHN